MNTLTSYIGTCVVRGVDPSLRPAPVSTYASIIDRSIPTGRLMATVGGLIGLLALILAGRSARRAAP